MQERLHFNNLLLGNSLTYNDNEYIVLCATVCYFNISLKILIDN